MLHADAYGRVPAQPIEPGPAETGPNPCPGLEVVQAGWDMLLHPSGALWLPALKLWLVADVHLGKAVSFRQLGVPVPEATTAATLNRLSGLMAQRETRGIVFLGDFLHSVRSHASGTLSEILRWRQRHPEVDLTLVRGNHDDKAGDPPAALGIRAVDEPLRIKGDGQPLALCHYPQPVPGAHVLAGHWHPCVVLSGRADRLRLPCFWFRAALTAPLAKYDGESGEVETAGGVGVLPAFGDFTGMHAIARQSGDRVFAIAGDTIREVPAARL
ncbi:MAG: ligase-associated DNA damage response endonuclease PdeM [Pseudomonadota bacterium]